MKCTCPARPLGARHAQGCPAAKRDKRQRQRKPGKDANTNARRVIVRTDHAALRRELPKLAKASPVAQDEAAVSIAAILARDGGGPHVH